MVFLISFFLIVVLVGVGLFMLELEYCDILWVFGVLWFMIFLKIVLFKILLEFFGVFKVVVMLVFIGINFVEIVSFYGCGFGVLFKLGEINVNYLLMFVVLIVFVVLGILFYYVVVMLECIFVGWVECFII